MKYRVQHTTRYLYSEPVTLCHNEVHLRPRNSFTQTCLSMQLDVSPAPAVSNEHNDYYGNHVTFFTVQERHKKMEVTCYSEVQVNPALPPVPEFTTPWEQARDVLRGEVSHQHLDAAQYIYESPYVRFDDRITAYAQESFAPRRPVLAGAVDLMHRIHQDFEYDPRATTIMTPVREVFEKRRGVCQDFSHLMLSCLRGLGIAARYVSGYLLTSPPADGEKLVGADASHAWLAVYCPGFGWVDLDPTNDLIPSEKHVLVAWGRDYADVSPIKGVILGGGQHNIQVEVDVTAI